MKVDNDVRLVDILPEDLQPDPLRRVCALEINGKSPVRAALLDLEARHPQDFGKLMNVILLVAEGNETVGMHVKRGKGKNNHDIFEMRAGQTRLFYFVRKEAREIVICTNAYWKARGSTKLQDAQFAKASGIKAFYEHWLEKSKRAK